jgi:NTP pyrophosphatase (non-canonical NTP hydrolase)
MATPVQLKEATSLAALSLNDVSLRVGPTYQELIDFTYSNFFLSLPLLRTTNTPENLANYLRLEARELREAIETNKSFIDIASEVGDLFHFFHDLLKISDVSVATMLDVIQADLQDASIEEVKKLFVSKEMLKQDAEQIVIQLVNFLEIVTKLGPANEVVLSAIAMYLFTIATKLNVNEEVATLFKHWRNRNKYNNDDGLFDDEDGDYSTIRQVKIDQWRAKGGDKVFFLEWFQQVPVEDLFAMAPSLSSGARSPSGTDVGWVIP